MQIPEPPSIGKNLKMKRQEKGLSLDELSNNSGVSKAMLSQIESGKANPTVATLWKIAHALGVDFNALLKGEGDKIRKFQINRREDVTVLDTDEEGAHINVLSPITMAEDLELYLLTFKPRGILHSTPHYPETEEILTVLNGKVRVAAGKNAAILNEGDVLIYQCDVEHSIENLSERESKIYLVVRFRQ